jgi:hypothetical protein
MPSRELTQVETILHGLTALITPPQLVAFVALLVALGAKLGGVDVSAADDGSIAAIIVALVAGDSYLRGKRVENVRALHDVATMLSQQRQASER